MSESFIGIVRIKETPQYGSTSAVMEVERNMEGKIL
jgi:hypothetical protein